jgi:hypothetical protein
MNIIRTLTIGFLLLAATSITFAQVERPVERPDMRSLPASPTVTISISARGVRFAALGGFKQMRLEVFDASGSTLYNSEFQAGNVRDWSLEDKQGQRLPDGTYLCVITVRDLSGRLVTKQGNVLVQSGQASLQMGVGEPAGAVEQEKTLAPVTDNTATAVTLISHDGSAGQVVSTRGGLTFRDGDFFAGKDRELMRLTPEGNLGVGVTTPQAKLDVGGTIRARGGILFDDGTMLTSAGRTASNTLGVAGGSNPTTNITGTGAANKLSKWIDGTGTLGDSTIFENANGDIGIGTSSPGGVLDLQRNSNADLLQRFFNTGSGGAKLRYVAATGATSQLQLTDHTGWLMSIAGNRNFGMQFRVLTPGASNTEDGLDSSAKMAILPSGRVGIGTTAPQALLHVAGDIKVTGDAVIDGNIAAKYQDVAEWVSSRQQITVATVVILDTTRTNSVVASYRSYDTHIAGVVSAKPGVILGEGGAGKVMVATTGRVRVKVDASKHPIKIGDLLVTSGHLGVAMRSQPIRVGGTLIHRPGTIIGKALEPLAKGKGEILVLLSLQ